jgi:glutaredoxin
MKASAWTASAALTALATALVFSSTQTQAQAVFRIVGPDGRVTFSDKPPAPSDKATKLDASGRAGGAAGAELPFELRQIVNRYPVTLYSGEGCEPCNSGRSFLTGRGIPFSERTVTTAQDAEALKSLSGETTLPFLSIGGQRIRGFQLGEWTQFLDAAGYPQNSMLSASYRNPPASPLTQANKPAPPKASEPSLTQPPPPTPTVNPDNPAGIRF